MITSTVVTLIKRAAPDWSRSQILDLVNEVNRQMLQHEVNGVRAISTTTGVDEKLTTVAAQYVYEVATTASPAFSYDGWLVTKVYSSTSDEDSDVACTTIPGNRDTKAKIIFDSDPGGSEYYVRYYKEPTSISSESVQIEVPESGGKYNWHMEIVMAVIGMIEMFQSGVISNKWNRFNEIVLPSFWDFMNKGITREHYTGRAVPTPSRGY